MDNTKLIDALQNAADYLKSRGIDLSDLHTGLEALKTEEYYRRGIRRDVLDYYRGDMEAGEFIDDMIRLIEGQLQKAWNEGMRDNGLDPKEDMEEAWEEFLQGMIDNELDHVLDFAEAIEKARAEGTGYEQLYSRADLWANRYPDVVNTARQVTADAKDKFEWVYGDTDHCATCEGLNGIVASRAQWDESGYHPQAPPNDRLECGGWRCRCQLVPTTARRTPGGIPSL